MSNPTVSDAKRAFYATHQRPIHSIYRRVVEELLVEMHLLTTSPSFRYDPIFACGVIASYDRFMESYQPETEKTSILGAVFQALGQDLATYRRDTETMLSAVADVEWETRLQWLAGAQGDAPEFFRQIVENITEQSNFRYSRLFGIGLFTLLGHSNPALSSQDNEALAEKLNPVSQHLHLPADKLNRDMTTYANLIERMAQAKVVMEEGIQAERKKRAQREEERRAKAGKTKGNDPVVD